MSIIPILIMEQFPEVDDLNSWWILEMDGVGKTDILQDQNLQGIYSINN